LNAGNKFKDLDHIERVKKEHNLKVDIQYLEDKPLIAVQGPLASHLLSTIIDPGLATLPFMNMVVLQKNGIEYQVNRCGYTGEDGFEVVE
jgi:aminomethyltransferase